MTNMIKTAALTAALALGATAATANNFGFQTTVDDNDAITLNMINADAAGFVVIYDYSGGEFGDIVGQAEVAMGANDDVVVPLQPTASEDLAAVLYAGPITNPMEADAWIELDVSDDS